VNEGSPNGKSRAWLALADGNNCRLLSHGEPVRDQHKLREHAKLVKKVDKRKDAGLTTARRTTYFVENKDLRFAGEIVRWLQHKADQHEIDRLVIVAPPSFSGLLRMVPQGAIKVDIEEWEDDLIHLDIGQLASHVLIRDLVMPYPSDTAAQAERRM
jgi:protein required for attachment to host cells